MAKNYKINQWSLLILRLAIAAIFIYHGYGKLFVSGGFPKAVAMMNNLSIPLPTYSALLVGVVEFFGGILLLLGLLTKWASLALIADMLVALFKLHLKQGFGASEFVLLVMASLIVILLSGSGKFSMGNSFKKKILH